MSKGIYKLTREIAIILSCVLSAFLFKEGMYVRSLMNIIQLLLFLYTSNLFEKRCNVITISYLFIFIVLYFVDSLSACFCTEEIIAYLNELGKFGVWTKDYYILYFWGIFLSYIFLIFYLKYFCRKTKFENYKKPREYDEIVNMHLGCILTIVFYYVLGRVNDIAIVVLAFLLVSVVVDKKRRARNFAICLIGCIWFKDILLMRYLFVQIVFPALIILLITPELNKREIKMWKLRMLGVGGLVVVGIYGTISEVYKLNTFWNMSYDLESIFASANEVVYFFMRQLHRIFAIWIKLGAYIIEHVQNYGFYYGITYVKALAPVFGFEYISLPLISAMYHHSTYAQPGLVAEGYANFGVIGIVMNICLVFFLMEYFRVRFCKRPSVENLLFMTVPFTKILLDGGSINSAVILICFCLLLDNINIMVRAKRT